MQGRRIGRSLLVALGGVCAEPTLARADLASDFADKITADTQYVTGINNATDIAFSNDGRAVVIAKGGQIWVRRANGTKNMAGMVAVDTASEKGLLGVVAHPTMPNTFFFYASVGNDDDDKHHVFRGTLDANDTVTIDMANPIVSESLGNGPGLHGPANHDGGGLFVYQNQLYVSVGDTGANATPPTNKFSSCLNLGNGKILRVNLDGSVPTDNPLANEAMVTSCDTTGGAWGTAAPDRRVYAWGLRNPWRFWIDPHTGLFWIGDVGEGTREEISVGRGNQHYGYPFHEGFQDWSMMNGGLRLQKDCDQDFAPSRACTPPVYDYTHSNGANCVIGGLIPEGCGWTNAFGGKLYYLFGDHGAGWIHALEVRADRMGVASMTAVEVGTFTGGPSSFRMGPDGALYVVMDGVGAVYRLSPTEQSGGDCAGGTGGGGTGGAGGGASGTGASGGSSGAGGDKDVASEDEDGCGCRTAGRGAKPVALAFVALGLAAALARRRRR